MKESINRAKNDSPQPNHDLDATKELTLKEQVSQLPLSPGVYQFIDKNGEVIYVGKAKSLRKRVSSYFIEGKPHSLKVGMMIRKICNVSHIVVASENDALLLENSLIKEFQPKYNTLLKDDKSYPWIAVLKEPFPRVISTRRLVRDGSQYFGPYSSISTQKAILEFIREVVPLRSCSLKLTDENIAKGKFSICLQYHLGNCLAPCVGSQSAEEYQKQVDMVTAVLKGDLKRVKEHLTKEMQAAAAELKFERAQIYKQRLLALQNYSSKSIIVSSKIEDADIFSLLQQEQEPDRAYCNHVKIRHGSIVGVYTVQLSVGLASERGEILSHAIELMMERNEQRLCKEVILSDTPAPSPIFDGVVTTIPKRGDKMELLQFSQRSATIYRAEQIKRMEIYNPERHADRLMASMQRELRMEREPRHIECFDNSNLQGTNAVAACVVFRNGKPSKKEYRHFNVKTVVGADDFATMREIVGRRYRRLLDEGAELPDLVIVDGGKGQLSSAYSVFCELGIENRVTLVGLAKRIEEVFYPNDPMPYYLSKTGEPLKVICHLRDEAHRFGITFHRKQRSKSFIVSELEDVSGLGEKGRTALMKKFKSVAKIKSATKKQLAEVVGESKAQKIIEHFCNAAKLK
ncbi:MAG: excinuclease ABC subunit UvrC [Rikenellaceae bacterium]